jgi:hypothetical protein
MVRDVVVSVQVVSGQHRKCYTYNNIEVQHVQNIV